MPLSHKVLSNLKSFYLHLGYVNFVNYIRGKYASNSNLKIFAACGPLISNPCCELVQKVAIQQNLEFIDLQNILTYPGTSFTKFTLFNTNLDDYGCDYHPAVSGQQKMADTALPIIRQVMNWYGTGSTTTTTGSTTTTTGSGTTGSASTGVATITAKVLVTIQTAGKSLDISEFIRGELKTTKVYDFNCI